MQSVVKFSLAHSRSGRFWPVILAGGFALSGWSGTIVVTNTAPSGPGSFQQAILTANATPGVDTIVFNISGAPPFTITPTVALPQINEAVVIDATTQPGWLAAGRPVIELNGAASGNNAGLRFGGGASTLRGLAINRFTIQAIELDSASNTIQGNFIGTDVTGSLARGGGIGSHGIFINNSAGNLIGGTNAGEGNVIAGGNDSGIFMLNASSTSCRAISLASPRLAPLR